MTPEAARELIEREVFPRLGELITRSAKDLYGDLVSARPETEAGGLCVNVDLKITVLHAPDPATCPLVRAFPATLPGAERLN